MIANNILRQFFTQVLGLFVGFFISIITSRILGVEGRGDFALIINTSSFITLLLGFSLGSVIVYVVSSEKLDLRRTLNTLFIIILMLFLVCFTLFFLIPIPEFNVLIPKNQDPFFSKAFLLILFVTSLFSALFNSVLNGKQLFRQTQNQYFWIASITLSLYFILFYFKKNTIIDVKYFLIFYVIVNSMPVIGAFFLYVKYVRPTFKLVFLDRNQLKYLLNFSFLAYVANILQFLSYRMDFWFVQYYCGARNLGIYSLSVNLSQMLWILPTAISTILVSYTGSENQKDSIYHTNILSRICFSFILLVTISLTIAISTIIPFLYGDDFIESSFLFKILLIGIVPFTLTTIIAAYFAGKGEIKTNLYCSIIGFIVCLLLDLTLIPKYGNKGAALATVASYFSCTIFILFIYLKRTKSNLLEVVFIKKDDLLIIKKHFKSFMVKCK